jgi:hypothetical protein
MIHWSSGTAGGPDTGPGRGHGAGISHGLASHHLRQLAKYGFVEQVEGKDHRERPWRLTTTSATWRGADATPEGAAAANVLEQVLAERALAQFLGWQQRRQDWPEAWRNHTGIGQSTIYLTLPELVELVANVEALIQRYVDERPLDDIAARPPGSVPVDITQFAVPLAGPPGDGRRAGDLVRLATGHGCSAPAARWRGSRSWRERSRPATSASSPGSFPSWPAREPPTSWPASACWPRCAKRRFLETCPPSIPLR